MHGDVVGEGGDGGAVGRHDVGVGWGWKRSIFVCGERDQEGDDEFVGKGGRVQYEE